MPRKSRTTTLENTAPLRLEAARKFAIGDRVCRRTNNKTGEFIGICDGFNLPEVWITWDETESERQITYSCNPLELELVERRDTELNVLPESEPTAVETPEAQLQVEPAPEALPAPVLSAVEPSPQLQVELLEVTTIVGEELTDDELSDRQRLELKVERAFYEAGAALRELRDRRLYRTNHRTFEEYCRDRFGMAHSAAYYLMAAATVMDNLISKCPQFVEVFPTRESQCRELAKLDVEEQPAAWIESLNRTGGKKVPSAAVVRGVVTEIKERCTTPVSTIYKEGDIFVISSSSGELRKYSGCWAIATQINNYTISVQVHDGDLIVRPDNLEPIDSPSQVDEVRAIAQRIWRLRQCGLLDRAAYYVLEGLGRQTYLTPLEAKLLALLEQEYGVE